MPFWKECDVPVEQELRLWREAVCAYMSHENSYAIVEAAVVADLAVLELRERIQPTAFDSRLQQKKD